jgi:energy-converting hydrogenase Eha subunit A
MPFVGVVFIFWYYIAIITGIIVTIAAKVTSISKTKARSKTQLIVISVSRCEKCQIISLQLF